MIMVKVLAWTYIQWYSETHVSLLSEAVKENHNTSFDTDTHKPVQFSLPTEIFFQIQSNFFPAASVSFACVDEEG